MVLRVIIKAKYMENSYLVNSSHLPSPKIKLPSPHMLIKARFLLRLEHFKG